MSREKAEKEKEHVAEMDDVITKVRISDVVVFLEEKVKLLEDLGNAGS